MSMFCPSMMDLLPHLDPMDWEFIRQRRVVILNRCRGLKLGKPELWALPATQEELESGIVTIRTVKFRPKYCPVNFDYERLL